MILLTSSSESFVQFLVVLILFVAILVLTRFTTRWIAGYQKKSLTQTNLEVIETLKITTNKYVQIIRTGKDHYLVIGIGKDEIVKLGELDDEDLRRVPSSSREEGKFDSFFNKFKDRFSNHS